MRKHYIDNIKWITVSLVVLYHVFYIYNATGVAGYRGYFYDFQPQDGIQYLLYPWFMVLLFVVSGMNSRSYLEKRSAKDFAKSRTVKLLVPSTLGLLAFQWIQGVFNMLNAGAFSNIKEGMSGVAPKPVMYMVFAFSSVLSGTGVLWYIQVLWVLSMLLLLIRLIEKDKLYNVCGKMKIWMIFLLIIPFWLSAKILTVPLIVCYKFGIYGFSFLMGYFIFSHDNIMEDLKDGCIPFIVASPILGIIYMILYFGTNYSDMPVFGSPLAIVFSFTTVLAILGGMKRWGDRTNRFADFMSKKSFGLYMFHYLGLSIAAFYLYPMFPAIPAGLIYILTAIASLITGFGLPEIISRIPVYRWFVMGISKKRN